MKNLKGIKKESIRHEIMNTENAIEKVVFGIEPAGVSTITGKKYVGVTVLNIDEVAEALTEAGYVFRVDGNSIYIDIE